LPVEVAKTIERITGVRVLLTYGATEYTQNIAQGPRDGDPKYGSAGLRLPYSQFKTAITDAEGVIQRECMIDEIGTVFIQGPSVTPGYVDPIYNDGIFSKDGWFNSGDLGRIDADGYLWLTGRAKDVIIRGGHNIDPSIIEETLRTHPDVVLVAAVSKPDAHSGELPVAYVQLTPRSKATSAQLVDFAKEHITEQAAAPKDVYILETMPLTDVGKPHKTQLRLDSAKRAFTDLMKQTLPADTSIEVTVQQHATHGVMVSYKLKAVASKDQSDLENTIKTAMKAYASHFEIIWN
jgi:fatty-acyl-CoA synthase